MIVAEGYSLQVCCDNNPEHKRFDEFYGKDKRECYREMARAGWRRRKTGDYCPLCTKQPYEKGI